MNRRAFLSLSAVSPLAHLLPALAQDPPRNPGEVSADIAVVGGGVGGVACALAAARNGLRVVLTEQYDWIGGQLTSQAVPPDEYPSVETFPCTRLYGTFRTKVRDFYRRAYPLTDAARANEIATLFTNVGLPLVVKDLSAIPGAADKTRPNSFELWFGSAPLPASCG